SALERSIGGVWTVSFVLPVPVWWNFADLRPAMFRRLPFAKVPAGIVTSRMPSSSRTVTRRSSTERSWRTPFARVVLSLSRSLPGVLPYLTVALIFPRPSGRYQIGDDQDRS